MQNCIINVYIDHLRQRFCLIIVYLPFRWKTRLPLLISEWSSFHDLQSPCKPVHFGRIKSSCRIMHKRNQPIFVHRNITVIQLVFHFSVSSVLGGGGVLGYYVACDEVQKTCAVVATPLQTLRWLDSECVVTWVHHTVSQKTRSTKSPYGK